MASDAPQPGLPAVEVSPGPEAKPTVPLPPISIIVPTYKECENLPLLIDRLDKLRADHQLTLELLIMDDNSSDGSEEAVAALHKDWVRFIVRTTDRGLSPAVVDGLRQAKYDILVVMDADLSHPPEVVPQLVQQLVQGADFVIGSRYVAGGTTDAEWGLFRWLNSKVATLMARPFTKAQDPMAGFFALQHKTFERGAKRLNPIGYKIGLELLVKCNCTDVREVPIHFADRQHGQSKLSLKEQLRYVQHLRRLFIYRYWTWSHLVQFLAVGASGTIVNLVVLSVLKMLDAADVVAVAGGIIVSLVSNFVLNRRFTFSYARHESMVKQFLGFTAACAVGMLVNFAVTMLLLPYVPPIQLAAALGIVAGMAFNFLCTRFLVFRFKGDSPEHFRSTP